MAMYLIWLRVALVLYGVCSLTVIPDVLTGHDRWRKFVHPVCVSAFYFHLVALVEMMRLAHHWVPASLHEVETSFALLLTLTFLAIYWRYRAISFGLFVLPVIFLLLLLPASQPDHAPVSSQWMHNGWILLHIALLLVAYTLLLFSLLSSLLYLIQERRLKNKHIGGIFSHLPPLDTIDHIAFVTLVIGLPCMTLGLLAGALIAQESVGAAYFLDPKVLLSIGMWVLYVWMLYVRRHTGLARQAGSLFILAGISDGAHGLGRQPIQHSPQVPSAMNFVLIGVNHKSAPLQVRERLAIPAARLQEATLSLLSVPCVREGMILSTCNRVEFLTYQEPAQADLLEFIQNYFAIGKEALHPYMYEYRASEVVRHVFRVASSLDSLVVGEPQILGQVKESYSLARSIGGINTNLDPLMQRAFTVARKVRNQTSIGISSVSIASVGVDLARKIFGSLQGKTVLLMGAGKMGELAARSMMQHGASTIYICNRTYERAVELAGKFPGVRSESGSGTGQSAIVQPISYDLLHQYAATADIIVSSTGAENPIFNRAHAEQYMQRRKQRPMFFIDIAVPRDVDPEINNVEGVFVYNIDDLQAVAVSNMSSRTKEAMDAEVIIRTEVEKYTQRMQSLNGVPAIVALQQSLEDVRQNEMRRMAPRLAQLSSEQLQAVEQMTRALVHKLQHAPIQAIKRAAQEGDRETLAVIQTVFDLEHHEKTDAAIETAESVIGQREQTETAFVPTPDATAVASDG